jgi:hypothetical protein
MGGSGPLICGKEVVSWTSGKGEELHRELTSHEIPTRSEVRPQDLTGGHMVEGIREELKTVSPFWGFGNRRSRGDSQ